MKNKKLIELLEALKAAVANESNNLAAKFEAAIAELKSVKK